MSQHCISFSDGRRCKHCQTWKNMLFLLVLCGLSCSIWLLWGLEDYGVLVRIRDLQNERMQSPFDRYNLSKDHLQALALLISSLQQGRFYEWMNKPVTGEILSSSLLHSLSELQSEMDDSQDQQHRRRNNIVFQGHCPTQSDPVLVRSAQLSPKGHYTQDILPSTINSDEISLKSTQQGQHLKGH
ncbi:uncharacterized protein LOC135598839 isoform X1 [Musa acuminata AAA Group]|uniref:uncharacterized protein LOC135598839 isoform X1 n=1 Tax=Musa acuminata AAA Group TaxID=214697 RepID=UPI0031D6BAEC